LRREAWGQGYAREAAEASLAWGWATLDIPRITAITVPANHRSWNLMERLGMTRDPAADFDHPAVPDGSPLKQHILYRIVRPA
jgi:RimJ/RimL family protein N-acetyltransferase